MMYFVKTLFLFLIAFNFSQSTPLFASGKPSLITEANRRGTIDTTASAIAKIDALLAVIGDQEKITWETVKSYVLSIDGFMKFIQAQPASNDYQIFLSQEAKHSFETKRECKSGCKVDCSTCRGPSYHGFDCKECGCGKQYGWHYQCWNSINCDKNDGACVPCMLVWGTFFCAGIQCYPYQWILSPFNPNAWDCSQAGVGSVSCSPKSETIVSGDKLKNWSNGLRTYLVTFKGYLEKDLSSPTGAPKEVCLPMGGQTPQAASAPPQYGFHYADQYPGSEAQ